MSRYSYQSYSLKDRVVLITGATSGIGESCAWRFANEGAKLILLGRRGERLDKVKEEIQKEFPSVQVHNVIMSVSNMDDVAALPSKLPEEFKNVEVLVNNAGLALGVNSVDTNDIKEGQIMMDTNVMGVIAMCRAFTPGMIARGLGHVINIGSIAGLHAYPKGTIYNASKFAVNGFTQAMRHDLNATPIRVCEIRPGAVNTEFSLVRFNGAQDTADKVYADLVPLVADDIADQVLYAATRPPHVQVADITIYPTNQCGPKDIARVGANLGAPSKA